MTDYQELLARARALTKKEPKKVPKVQMKQEGPSYTGPMRRSISAFFLCDKEVEVWIGTCEHAFVIFGSEHLVDAKYCDPALYDREPLIVHGHRAGIPCAAPYMCFESSYRPKDTDHPEFKKQFYLKWKALK